MLITKCFHFQNNKWVSARKSIYFYSLFFALFCFQQIEAQDKNNTAPVNNLDSFDIRTHSFLLPLTTSKGKYSHSISVYWVVPPKIWTLDAINAPMVNYSAKYTLPKGFNFQAGISSLIISNRINAGPFWNYTKDHHHFGIGYQLAFNYGVLNQFGFKTTLTGWEQQPSITYGYSFKKTALIVRGDFYYTTSLNISEGGHVIPYKDDFINGYSITTTFEQRLHKSRILALGLKINYLRYHILAWPALPVNSYYYYFPEFQVGFHL